MQRLMSTAEFAYDKSPLPASAHAFNHPVNRDREYDFYAKESEFFRQMLPKVNEFLRFDVFQRTGWRRAGAWEIRMKKPGNAMPGIRWT